ncbi:MAG: hypothetical protein BYD32DRAFT_488736 [Podila humilis]|nr:MAG: hypothetical protein BYD32DRAFT_488736 [Podila humilis]
MAFFTSSSRLYLVFFVRHSTPMPINKTICFVVTAAISMLLATVEAAPATERLPCIPCDPPFCGKKCSPGYWCDFNECTCKYVCRKGPTP